MADQPQGRFARLVQLGAMTGKVAGSYVREQVKAAIGGTEIGKAALDRLHVDNARDMADAMSRLKGAAMKVGQQFASLVEGMDLPPEVAQSLSKLNAAAEPVPYEVIRAEVESSLERPLTELFTWFDQKPLGTASLAQAHAATLPDGRDVVVKVLHRGVGKSVGTDLMALKAILLSNRAATGRSREEMDEIFDEVRARLEEELDYLQEAANLAAYARMYGDDPRLVIPRPVVSLCTDRVLVMDRVQGLPLETFLAMATPAARQRAGQTLANFYYEQVFIHRTLHADPHPGNYLFQPDGRVGVLDFGCVKRFDVFWIGAYAEIALHMLDGNHDEALTACIAFGAWDGVDSAAGEALWRFILAIGGGFRRGVVELGGPEERFLDELKDAGMGLIKHPSIRAPRDIIMLHRSLGGLYSMGRKLHLTMDFGALLRGHAEQAVAAARGR
jgi:predicted unusual protein kinase regulating ubiquinone biosynthesis (AarF/ABC1/UbiB family)